MGADFKNVVIRKTLLKLYITTYIRLRLLCLKSYISVNNARIFMKFSESIFCPTNTWKDDIFFRRKLSSFHVFVGQNNMCDSWGMVDSPTRSTIYY